MYIILSLEAHYREITISAYFLNEVLLSTDMPSSPFNIRVSYSSNMHKRILYLLASYIFPWPYPLFFCSHTCWYFQDPATMTGHIYMIKVFCEFTLKTRIMESFILLKDIKDISNCSWEFPLSNGG